MKCKHCGEEFENDTHKRTSLMRCDPNISNLPYGYNAELEGSECKYPCMGVKTDNG